MDEKEEKGKGKARSATPTQTISTTTSLSPSPSLNQTTPPNHGIPPADPPLSSPPLLQTDSTSNLSARPQKPDATEDSDDEKADSEANTDTSLPPPAPENANITTNAGVDAESLSTGTSTSSYSRSIRTSWYMVRRWLPFIGGRMGSQFALNHSLMAIGAVAIVMLSLLIAGCSSYRMRAIYLLSLSYAESSRIVPTSTPSGVSNWTFHQLVSNISSAGNLEIRIGYFGFCISTTTLNFGEWICESKILRLTRQINPMHDPLDLLGIAENYQDEVVLSLIIIMATVLVFLGFCALSTFPGWEDEFDEEGDVGHIRHMPSEFVIQLVIGSNLLSALFLLVAVLWQHIASVAHTATTQAVFGDVVRTSIGAAAVGLGWGAFGATVFVAIQMVLMALEIRKRFGLAFEDDDY
ncbi:Ca2+ regulator and membrane fusion protein Fig1-domain-containing protein [Aspergillus granulosus]|uniref:Ca2+ regulator and membrane fusion protein Fig1-domain-containing protein n=1 Tax=Aspergillus granulosus TaxID=176169 RepID=A0ABR4HI12_9EURO